MFFYKYWKRWLVKRLLVNKIFFFSILHRLRIKKIYAEDISSYLLQLEAYYILTHTKLKINFHIGWNSNWLEEYTSNCTLSFLLFHNNKSITINKFKKWISIPACFENGKLSYTSLELHRLTFWLYCNKALQA